MKTTLLQSQFSHFYILGSVVVREPRMQLPGSSLTPIFLSGLRCESGTHSKILDCDADRGTTTCSHDQDVVVLCKGKLYSIIM